MRLFLVLLAAGFAATAAAVAVPELLAGFAPDGLAVGLPLAGFVLAALAAALFPKEGVEPGRRPPNFARDGASDASERRIPAEGGTSPYGPENGPTSL